MDKDCRVSIETISAQFDVSVGIVHTIIREELKMRKICPKDAQRRWERKTLLWQQGDGRADQFRSRSSWCFGDCDESSIYCYDPETKRQSSQWKHAGSPRPKKARQSKSTHKLLMILFFFFFFDNTGMIYMHWVPTGQTVNKEYYVEVLKEFRKRFRRKKPALLKSGQWHFHGDNAPVHISILVTDYLTKMGIKTVPHPTYSRDLWLLVIR